MLQRDRLGVSGITRCNLRGTEAVLPFGFFWPRWDLHVGRNLCGRLPLNPCAESQGKPRPLPLSSLLAFSQALCCAPINSTQEKSHLEGATPEQCGLKPVRVVWSQGTHYSAIQVVISKFWLGQHFALAISLTLLIQSPELRNAGFWVSL